MFLDGRPFLPVGTISPVVDFEHLEEVFVITQLKDIGGKLDSEDTVIGNDTQSTETSTQDNTEE